MGAFCPSRKCEDEAKVWTLGFMALTKEVSDMPIGDVVLCPHLMKTVWNKHSKLRKVEI